MRLIEFTEDDGCGIGDRFYAKGARDTFPDDEAAQYIKLGWARDPVTGDTGERKPGAVALEVEPLKQSV